MNVHLIRKSDVSKELYLEVVELIQEFNGPLKFQSMEGNLPTLTNEDFQLNPKDILNVCKKYRQNNDIGKDEIVVLLTESTNTLNWFSYGDENKNIFIQTSGWDFYLDCNRSFPIAYEVASNVFQVLLFNNMEDLENHIHIEESRGCVLDFCKNKKDIRLKMKTADVCTDCLGLVQKRSFRYDIFLQITKIFEGVRKKLISVERFINNLGPGRVIFKKHIRKMILMDVGNYEVKLTPLEKTVYHLFMENIEGIMLNDIAAHKSEIISLYDIFFNGNNIAQFNNSIDALCDYLDPSLQQKISKINRKLKGAMGKQRAEEYIIKRDVNDDRYMISIDRSLVSYED